MVGGQLPCGEFHADSKFVFEEPGFAVEAAAVAGEFSRGADDAVAGDDDGEKVVSVGAADGARGCGGGDGGGLLAVGAGFAGGDGAEVGPGAEFEGRAGGGEGAGEVKAVAGEVVAELAGDE